MPATEYLDLLDTTVAEVLDEGTPISYHHCWFHVGPTVSRASRPARSRSGAGASASRMQRRRVRAVSVRLEDVQKVLTDLLERRVESSHTGLLVGAVKLGDGNGSEVGRAAWQGHIVR